MHNRLIKFFILLCGIFGQTIFSMNLQTNTAAPEPLEELYVKTTELAAANKENPIKAVAVIKELNVDLNITNQHKQTLLHLCHSASKPNNAYLAQILLLAGVKVAHANKEGIKDDNQFTALYIAISHADVEEHKKNKALLKLYLDSGANPYEESVPPQAKDAIPKSVFEWMIFRSDIESMEQCFDYQQAPTTLIYLERAAVHTTPLVLELLLANIPYSHAAIQNVIAKTQSAIDFLSSHAHDNAFLEIITRLQNNATLLTSALQTPAKFNRTFETTNENLVNRLWNEKEHRPQKNSFLALRAREIGLPRHMQKKYSQRPKHDTLSLKSSRKRKLETHESKEDKHGE